MTPAHRAPARVARRVRSPGRAASTAEPGSPQRHRDQRFPNGRPSRHPARSARPARRTVRAASCAGLHLVSAGGGTRRTSGEHPFVGDDGDLPPLRATTTMAGTRATSSIAAWPVCRPVGRGDVRDMPPRYGRPTRAMRSDAPIHARLRGGPRRRPAYVREPFSSGRSATRTRPSSIDRTTSATGPSTPSLRHSAVRTAMTVSRVTPISSATCSIGRELISALRYSCSRAVRPAARARSSGSPSTCGPPFDSAGP